MLSGDQFAMGDISMASGTSLVLPRNQYEAPLLVCCGNGPMVAIFLDGQRRFEVIRVEAGSPWTGFIIPKVRAEVDLSSLVDHGMTSAQGMMVRSGKTMSISAHWSPELGPDGLYQLEFGLQDCGTELAWFARWQLLVGEGDRKTVLWTHDGAVQ